MVANAVTALAPTEPWIIVAGALLETGGQDRANLALADYLADQGRVVHLVAHRVESRLARHRGVVHHAVPKPFNSDVVGERLLRWQGRRLAVRLRADRPHVLVNGGNCNWPDVNWVHYVHAAYARGGERGTLRRLRFRVSHQRWLTEERQALKRARLVIANSERTRKDLVERVGIADDRIRVVYYGIDADRFREPCPGERDTTRRELGWHQDRPVVLFIGALGDRRKGFDTVFRAWRSLKGNSGNLDPLLVVVGQGTLLDYWRQRTTDAGLANNISFLGFRHDVPALVRAADALVSPTRYEAYGLGVHEALCCGLPAIVTADAGIAERYPSALSALLLPDPEDDLDLAGRVMHCLTHHSALAPAVRSFAETLRARTWRDAAADLVALAQAS